MMKCITLLPAAYIPRQWPGSQLFQLFLASNCLCILKPFELFHMLRLLHVCYEIMNINA